jgi:hypothetical protein
MVVNSWIRPESVNPGILENGRIVPAPQNHPRRGHNYNSFVGGTSGSTHRTGMAADINDPNGAFRAFLLRNQIVLQNAKS